MREHHAAIANEALPKLRRLLPGLRYDVRSGAAGARATGRQSRQECGRKLARLAGNVATPEGVLTFIVISWKRAPRWISHFLAAPRSEKLSSAWLRVTNLHSEQGSQGVGI